MPLTDTEATGVTVLGIAGVIAAVFRIGKGIMQNVNTTKLETTQINSDITSYKRLHEEIERLREELAEQRAYVKMLEGRFDLLRDIELQGATDLGALSILIQNLPCGHCPKLSDGTCKAPPHTYQNIVEIITRMVERKDIKKELLREDTL